MRFRSRVACSVAACSFSACVAAGAASAAPTGDDSGMLAFNNHCRQCHSYKKDDNRLGPSLYGVVGRKAGSVPNFGNYSSSLQASGITWTPEILDKWITDPDAVVPGNNMAPPFPGVADEKQRSAIISFLQHDTAQAAKSPAEKSPTR